MFCRMPTREDAAVLRHPSHRSVGRLVFIPLLLALFLSSAATVLAQSQGIRVFPEQVQLNGDFARCQLVVRATDMGGLFVDDTLNNGNDEHISPATWHDYLNTTRRPGWCWETTSG